jgi:hypothetical protein
LDVIVRYGNRPDLAEGAVSATCVETITAVFAKVK